MSTVKFHLRYYRLMHNNVMYNFYALLTSQRAIYNCSWAGLTSTATATEPSRPRKMQATKPIKHATTCKIRYVYSTFRSISDGPSCFLSASSSASSNSSSSVTSFTTYKKKINFMSRFISLGKYLHCVVSVIFSGRRTSTSRCPPSIPLPPPPSLFRKLLWFGNRARQCQS